MKQFELIVHSGKDEITVTVGADSKQELVEMIENRCKDVEEVTDFIRFGPLVIRQANVDWIWIVEK